VEVGFKEVYRKKKANFWASFAIEMKFEGDWRVLEAKAFGLGKESLT